MKIAAAQDLGDIGAPCVWPVFQPASSSLLGLQSGYPSETEERLASKKVVTLGFAVLFQLLCRSREKFWRGYGDHQIILVVGAVLRKNLEKVVVNEDDYTSR